MNEIDNEEIARLMRVVSQPLRKSWERVMINGRSLEDVLASRDYAERKQKTYQRIVPVIVLTLMLAMMVSVCLLMNRIHEGYGLTFKSGSLVIVTVVLIIFGLWQVDYWSEKSAKMRRQIVNCNEIFFNFIASINALNPLVIGNIYHDSLTVAVVARRITDFAYKVIDAEDRFERLMKPKAGRSDVAHALDWINKCNSWFDCIWRSATVDFGLDLNKTAAFKKAIDEFTEREGREPAHLAKN